MRTNDETPTLRFVEPEPMTNRETLMRDITRLLPLFHEDYLGGMLDAMRKRVDDPTCRVAIRT